MDSRQTELVETHLPLVDHVVRKVAEAYPRHVDRSELASAGMLGLIEAATRYDDARGVPFGRFAQVRIRGAVLDAMRASDWAPRSLRRNQRAVRAAESELTNQLGRTPDLTEVADELGVEPRQIARLRERLQQSVVLTLDVVSPLSNDEESLAEMVPDPSHPDPIEPIEEVELRAYLRDAVHLLPERHRHVVRRYFFDGAESATIAEELDVTVSRVSQLRADVLDILREGIEVQFSPGKTERLVGRVAKRRARYASAVARASSPSQRLRTPPGHDGSTGGSRAEEHPTAGAPSVDDQVGTRAVPPSPEVYEREAAARWQEAPRRNATA